jgi:hypothetical protein
MEKAAHLAKIYFDTGNPGAFRGPKALLDQARAQGLADISLRDCREFLAAQPNYTLFRRSRRNYPRNTIDARFVGNIVQIDIMDMQRFRASNNYIYVLLAYDTYSKFLQGVPLKDRKAPGMVESMRTLLAGPIGFSSIYWDQEGSFLSRSVQNFLKNAGVSNYTTNSKVKAPGVERVIRTIRAAIRRYFHHNNTEHWEEYLPIFIRTYNHRVHSTTHQKPIDVVNNPMLVIQSPPPTSSPRSQQRLKNSKESSLPPIGSYVRLNKLRGLFEKEERGTFTSEVFRVVQHKTGTRIPMIRVQDMLGTPIIGSLYPPEYQQIIFNDDKSVEKILKVRHRRGKPTEYLATFVGYPAFHTQWVTAAQH